MVTRNSSNLNQNNTTSNERTMSLQPASLDRLNTAATNVSGDGSGYSITWDVEVYDVGGNMGSINLVSPISGIYLVTGSSLISGLTTSHTGGEQRILASNSAGTYRYDEINYGKVLSGSNLYCASGSALVNLDAADTCYMRMIVSNGTKVAGLIAGYYSHFSVTLLH